MDARERAAAEDRLRILELLEAALERRDEVFEVVLSSADPDEVEERIREMFDVEVPHISKAVPDMQESRWTRSEREAISAIADELRRLLPR